MVRYKPFSVRDFVNAGLFALLLLIATWVPGLAGFIPYLMPIVPFLAMIVSGPVYVLYTTKIQRPGMIAIANAVLLLAFVMSGHGYFCIPGFIISTILEEWLLARGQYTTKHAIRLAFLTRIIIVGSLVLPLFITRQAYYETLIRLGYGQAYADRLMSVMPPWSFVAILALALVGSWLGTTLGFSLNTRHFTKARATG